MRDSASKTRAEHAQEWHLTLTSRFQMQTISYVFIHTSPAPPHTDQANQKDCRQYFEATILLQGLRRKWLPSYRTKGCFLDVLVEIFVSYKGTVAFAQDCSSARTFGYYQVIGHESSSIKLLFFFFFTRGDRGLF